MKYTLCLVLLFSIGCNYPDLPEDENHICPAVMRPALIIHLQDQFGNNITNATVLARDLSSGFSEQLIQGFLPDATYLGVYERQGTYEVDISAPGFQNETITNIQVVRVRCNYIGGEYNVTLQ